MYASSRKKNTINENQTSLKFFIRWLVCLYHGSKDDEIFTIEILQLLKIIDPHLFFPFIDYSFFNSVFILFLYVLFLVRIYIWYNKNNVFFSSLKTVEMHYGIPSILSRLPSTFTSFSLLFSYNITQIQCGKYNRCCHYYTW